MDPRIAFSYRDVVVKQVDVTVQPSAQTTFVNLGPLTSEALVGYPGPNATDGNLTTVWSSHSFPSSSNTRGLFFAGYMPSLQPINTVRVTAAQSNGVFEGFPAQYVVSVTDEHNQSWINVAGDGPEGVFTTQPDVSGVATIKLPHTYRTWAIKITPIELGTPGSRGSGCVRGFCDQAGLTPISSR
jgi:hypothetical protein